MNIGTKENYELLRAIEENDLTNVIKYLDAGCSPNPTGQYESSPLMTALKKYGVDFSVFKHLLEYGADPNWEDTFGNTPFKEALKEQNKPVVKLFLKHKADPNKDFVMEPSPFEEVVRRGDIEFIKLLIENDADINLSNRKGQTPLEVAFMMDNTPVVNILKYYGAVIPSLKLDESPIDNPAFDRLMICLESLKKELEEINTKIKVLEEKNKMLNTKISELEERPVYGSSQNSKSAFETPIPSDDNDDNKEELDSSLDDSTEEENNDWDYQKKDKTCKMCAGTGFMGGADGEEETCPYCCGAGIE